MDFCNLTYLGPSKQMRAGRRLWEVGVPHLLPRHIAEKFIRTYCLAEWKLEDVCDEPEGEAEEAEETEPEPEPVAEKPKRKTRKAKTRVRPEPEAVEPESEDPTTEPFDEEQTNEEVE